MESMGVALDNLVYFALGLGCGLLTSFAYGRLLRTRITRTTPAHPTETGMKPARETFGHASATRGVVVLVISLILFGAGVRVGFTLLNDEVKCFDNYANDLADSLAPRQNANEAYQLRQEAVFEATANLLAVDPADRQDAERDLAEALEDYEEAKADLDAERAKNPYPNAPREVCEDD